LMSSLARDASPRSIWRAQLAHSSTLPPKPAAAVAGQLNSFGLLVLRVGSALQSRAIIVVLRVFAALVGGGRPSQAGLVPFFLVDNFAAVLDNRQPRLHVIELGGSHNILRPCRQDAGDLFLRLRDAIRGLWLRGRSLG